MTKVTMEIPPARASQMAQIFSSEGFEVTWNAPIEKRSGGFETEVVQVIFWLVGSATSGLIGNAAWAAAQRAAQRIRKQFPNVKIDIEDENAGDS